MGAIQDFIKQIANDPHVQRLEHATGGVVNNIVQGATDLGNTVGKTVGNMPIVNGGISGLPSIGQVAHQIKPTSPLSLATEGNVQKIPGQIVQDMSSEGKALRDPNTSQAASMGLVMGMNGDAGMGSKSSLLGGEAKDIPRAAVDLFNHQYIVPTKLALGSLRTEDTAREILAHIKSGMDLNMLEQTPGLLSGANGAISKAIRDVVSKIPGGEIPINAPGKAAEDVLAANRIWVNPDVSKDMVSDITAAMPRGANPGTMNALDALQYARDLEGKGAEAKAGSTYLTQRGDKKVIGHAFNSAADDVMEQIDNAAAGAPIESVKTPGFMSYLRSISPRLEQQVANAKNVSELRSTIGAFTRFGRMMEQDQGQAGSTFGRVAQGMKNGQTSSNIADALTNPKQATKGAINSGLQKLFSGFDKTPADQLNDALSGKTPDMPQGKFSTSSGKNKGLKSIALGTAGIGGLLAGAKGLESISKMSNANGQDPTNNSDNSHSATVQQNASNVKFSNSADEVNLKDPVLNPFNITDDSGNPVFISSEDYKANQKKINALKADPRYGVVNQFTNDVDRQNMDNETGHTDTPQMEQANELMNNISSQVKNAKALLDKTSPNMMDAVNVPGTTIGAKGVHEFMNKDYGSLMGIAQQLDTMFHTNIAQSTTRDSMLQKLDQLEKAQRYNYEQGIKNKMGGRTNTNIAPVVPITSPMNNNPSGNQAGSSFQPIPVNPLLQ